MTIRLLLSARMGEKRIRAKKLSEQTGITEAALSALYNEKRNSIYFETLEKLCKALECGVGDLLHYVPDEKTKKETKTKRKK